MRTSFVFVVSLFLVCLSSLARADTEPFILTEAAQDQSQKTNAFFPNYHDWLVIDVSRIELRISEDVVAYLGFQTEYRNPADSKEFIRVISRHLPLVVARQRPKNEKSLVETASLFYAQKEEKDRTNALINEADPFLSIHWRIKKNPVSGYNTLDGDVGIKFLSSDGTIITTGSACTECISVEFMTENIGGKKPHNVFAGMKYQIANSYHILRVDRDILEKIFEEKK